MRKKAILLVTAALACLFFVGIVNATWQRTSMTYMKTASVSWSGFYAQTEWISLLTPAEATFELQMGTGSGHPAFHQYKATPDCYYWVQSPTGFLFFHSSTSYDITYTLRNGGQVTAGVRVFYEWTGNSVQQRFHEKMSVYYKYSGGEVLAASAECNQIWSPAVNMYIPRHKALFTLTYSEATGDLYCDLRMLKSQTGTYFTQIWTNEPNNYLDKMAIGSRVDFTTLTSFFIDMGSITSAGFLNTGHTEWIMGDINNPPDRTVDVLDAIILSNAFGQQWTGPPGMDQWYLWPYQICDMAADGVIDALDSICLSNHWGDTLT